MRIVCGLDVHKDSIFLCILSSTGEIFEKKYGVLTNQLEEVTTQHPLRMSSYLLLMNL